ncbi:efflux RND transporter periplasmic adaptor subunit [Patescibacteria group bacterium]
MNSNIGSFFRKKSVKIIIGIIVVGLIASYFWGGEEEKEYVLAQATKGDIIQSVSVTGTIKADPSMDLHFQKSGKINEITVKEGDKVVSDQLLASLENETLELDVERKRANLQYARALYNQTQAGAKYEEILIAQADVQSAQAAYDAALVEADNTKEIGWQTVDLAELEYEDAQDEYDTTKELVEKELANLELTGNTSQSVALDNAYKTAETQLDNIFPTLQDSIYLAEETIGVRGTGYILLSQTNKNNLERTYHTPADNDYTAALEAYQALSADPSQAEVDDVIGKTLKAANSILLLLTQTGFELEKLPYDRTDLQNLIVEISAQSTALSTVTLTLQESQNTIITLKTGSSQDIETLTLSYQLQIDAAGSKLNAAENALAQAKLNSEISNKNVDALVALKKAALDTALANLELRKSPARTVDLAPLAAQITQAEIDLRTSEKNFRDGQLFAPIDAVVSFIYSEVGENISLTETSLSPFITLHAEGLLVEANVPETDIVKIKLKDSVEMTLDAFDFTEKFYGDVVEIDPAETAVQGVIYYKIKSAFTGQDDRIKSGMTVNLEIETDKKEDVLLIPIRALKFEDSTKYVEVLNNGGPKKTQITTGIENDQFVEILSGLKEGDKVITFVK